MTTTKMPIFIADLDWTKQEDGTYTATMPHYGKCPWAGEQLELTISRIRDSFGRTYYHTHMSGEDCGVSKTLRAAKLCGQSYVIYYLSDRSAGAENGSTKVAGGWVIA